MISFDEVVRFHGHACPGLAIGKRVAEAAIIEMGERPGDEEVVALVETDNCAVDAIQYITGCTIGKGNLILLDYGKNAFRFIRREDGKAIRITLKPLPDSHEPPGFQTAMQHWRDGTATAEETALVTRLRQQRLNNILEMPLTDMIEVQTIEAIIPEKARMFASINCERCGEKTMEIRLTPLDGRLLCPECLEHTLLER